MTKTFKIDEGFDIIHKEFSVRRHESKEFPSRKSQDIKQAVVHHQGGKGFYNVEKRHIDVNGWPGPSYHFYITLSGEVWLINSILKTTYHAKYANKKSIGICLEGNFDKDQPTEEQYYALRNLLLLLKKIFPDLKIKYHGEVDKRNQTRCPGESLIAIVEEFKEIL